MSSTASITPRAARMLRLQKRYAYESLDDIDEDNVPLSFEDIVDDSKDDLVLSKEMEDSLRSMGYSSDDIFKMTPDVASQLVEQNLTRKKRDQAALEREKALDKVDEVEVKSLNKAKSRLDSLTKSLHDIEKFQSGVEEELGSVIEDMESVDPESSDYELLSLRRELLQSQLDHIDQFDEIARNSVRSIETQIESISKVEQVLVDNLQEVNDAVGHTPGVEDDGLFLEILQDKIDEIGALSKSRDEMFNLSSEVKVLTKKMKSIRLKLDKAIKGKSAKTINSLRYDLRDLEVETSVLKGRHDAILRRIRRLEKSIIDESTQEKLDALDEILREENVKSELPSDDEGSPSPQNRKNIYDKIADDIKDYAGKMAEVYGDFIVNHLAQDIPSDPKVESIFKSSNNLIVRYANDAFALGERYGRNSARLSSIRVVPGMYKFLADSMNGSLDSSNKIAMVRLPIRREAGFFSDVWGKALQLKNFIGKGWSSFISSTAKAGAFIEKAVLSSEDFISNVSYSLMDSTSTSRDPQEVLASKRKVLQDLVRAKELLERQLASAHGFHDKVAGNEKVAYELREVVSKLQGQLSDVEDHIRRVSDQTVPSDPAHSDAGDSFSQSVRLMDHHSKELTSLLAKSFPQDRDLERALLHKSFQIASVADKMVTSLEKMGGRYPTLPSTAQAYGYMFLSLDKALREALRP